jgi:hypothetical protein
VEKLSLKNVTVTIEDDAEKVIKFLANTEVKIEADGPKAIAGLKAVVPAISKALGDVAADAANPSQIILTLPGQISDFKLIWPAVEKYVASL